MRGESVAVVSKNNSATDNVYAKLKKYGIDFIAAPLGSTQNKNKFLSEQPVGLPDMSGWKDKPNTMKMPDMLVKLNKNLKLKNELSALVAEEDALIKEKAYFDDCVEPTVTSEGNMMR